MLRKRWIGSCLLLVGMGCDKTTVKDSPALAASVHASAAVSPGASSSAAPEPPRDDLGPRVALDGTSRGLAVNVLGTGPRLYSIAMRTWIREKPSRSAKRIGYLRAGASSPTSEKPAGRDGCSEGWYPVHPRGFACVGKRATLDRNHPIVVATREHPPDASRKLPYIYGTVRRPGPIYSKLPSSAELRRAEPDVDERIPRWLAADGEIGANYAQQVWTPGRKPEDPQKAWGEKLTRGVPAFLADGAAAPNVHRRPRSDSVVLSRMDPRVGFSFLETFLFEGRRYGLTTDLEVMPTDRLRPIQGSDFHGVQIGKEIDFPFAFVRHPSAKLYTYQASSNRLLDAGKAEYRSVLKLTGKQKFFHKRLHYETADGHYISDLHASRLDPAKRMPAWGKRGDKWIDVNLTKQTLVLYEGEKAVYATLISSGEAGLEDPEHTTATKRGIFRIHTKHITTTMSSDEIGEEFELNDVPYVQYFDKEGYALHGAYWHDRFGTPKSHGCINLSPEDARRIFYWTEPTVPVGWHGVLKPLTGTVMFVHP